MYFENRSICLKVMRGHIGIYKKKLQMNCVTAFVGSQINKNGVNSFDKTSVIVSRTELTF